MMSLHAGRGPGFTQLMTRAMQGPVSFDLPTRSCRTIRRERYLNFFLRRIRTTKRRMKLEKAKPKGLEEGRVQDLLGCRLGQQGCGLPEAKLSIPVAQIELSVSSGLSGE